MMTLQFAGGMLLTFWWSNPIKVDMDVLRVF